MSNTPTLKRNSIFLVRVCSLFIILVVLGLHTLLAQLLSDFVAVTTSVGLKQNLHRSGNKTKHSKTDLTFWHLNQSDVYSFNNVCIESITVQKGNKSNEIRRIVVYNQSKEFNQTYTRCLFTSDRDFKLRKSCWYVLFTPDAVPTTHHRILPTTVFFASPNYMINPHHFWTDLFVRLFSVIKATNRLHVGMDNQILYSTEHDYYERTKYEEMLWTLHTTKFHDVYYKLPTNTCYSSAVFGAKNDLVRYRDAVDHVLAGLKIDLKSNEEINSSIVIVRRQVRRIVNIDELNKAAKDAGFNNVTTVSFENMTLKEQLTVAANTRVMVGVQGGALQWAIFMPPGSTLIEISWPAKYWFPFYEFVERYDVKFISMTATDIQVNWQAYETSVLKGKKCSSDEQLKLLKKSHSNNMYESDNIWRYADVFVDVKTFTKLIKQALNT